MLRVVVPATSANLGPGFDCLGLALEVANESVFAWADRDAAEVEGEGAECLPRDASHLSLQALRHGLSALGVKDARPVALRQINRIPLSRGMGSSAAAIVAGLAAARAFAGFPDDPAWLLTHANALEGHPDNVAAAIYGGCTAAWPDGVDARCTSLSFPRGLNVALAIPAFQVSTEKAREALPAAYPLADVSFSLSRAALLVAALAGGDFEALEFAVEDRIHTPYRARLIPGFEEARAAAREAGARGTFISGSGPTVASFVPPGVDAERVAAAMAAVFPEARAVATRISPTGVRCSAV
ncbi:MAG: homoserine kinase [Armatimonadetes bacterium]|nr:homoserine kinase [Armatimonadota bacterium]